MTTEPIYGSVYIDDCVKRILGAKSLPELEVAARALDDPRFDELNLVARIDLGALYTQRFFQLSGSLR